MSVLTYIISLPIDFIFESLHGASGIKNWLGLLIDGDQDLYNSKVNQASITLMLGVKYVKNNLNKYVEYVNKYEISMRIIWIEPLDFFYDSRLTSASRIILHQVEGF